MYEVPLEQIVDSFHLLSPSNQLIHHCHITHLSLTSEVCDNADQTAQYHSQSFKFGISVVTEQGSYQILE